MSLIAETSRPEVKAAPRATPKTKPKGTPSSPQTQLMKQRAIRYLFYYVGLLVVLTGVRFATASHARQLTDLQDQVSQLKRQSAQLHRDISSLESPARVRAWAVEHDMVPYSSGSFLFKKLESLPAVQDLPKPAQKVKVETLWR
jgi:cell division protein FtsL